MVRRAFREGGTSPLPPESASLRNFRFSSMKIVPIARALIGLALWVWGAFALVEFATAEKAGHESTASSLDGWLFRDPFEFNVVFPEPVLLEVGDLAYREGRVGPPAGELIALLDEQGRARPELRAWAKGARFRIWNRDALQPRTDATVRLLGIPELAGAWVFHTLVPPEKLELIREEWMHAWRAEKPEMTRRFLPLGREAIAILLETARHDTRPFLVRHRSEVEHILKEVEQTLGDDRLAELFESVVWPTVRERFEPIATELGHEIWDRLPLWSFSWRLAWQSLPLTRDDYLEERWRQFFAEEIAPLVTARIPEFVAASKSAARDVFQDPEVTGTLRAVALGVLTDPEFHRLLERYAREVFFENKSLRTELETFWASPRVQRELSWAAGRLETVVRKIGDLLFGTRATGISPEFADVLRAQILLKGKHRLCIDPGTDAAIPLPEGSVLHATLVDDDPRAMPRCGGRP